MARKLRIGELCKELEIQPYVLRYWETEFPFLNPTKSKSGQRSFSPEEVAVIRRIKELLYDEGYTIAGAKKKLESEIDAGEVGAAKTGRNKTGQNKTGQKRSAKTSGKGRKPAKPEQPELDRAGQEEIKNLRSGIESALGQARAILELLGSGAR